MTYATQAMVDPRGGIALKVTGGGEWVIRYALALVIGWIGMMKFTGYASHRTARREISVSLHKLKMTLFLPETGGQTAPHSG